MRAATPRSHPSRRAGRRLMLSAGLSAGAVLVALATPSGAIAAPRAPPMATEEAMRPSVGSPEPRPGAATKSASSPSCASCPRVPEI